MKDKSDGENFHSSGATELIASRISLLINIFENRCQADWSTKRRLSHILMTLRKRKSYSVRSALIPDARQLKKTGIVDAYECNVISHQICLLLSARMDFLLEIYSSSLRFRS